MDTEQIRAMVGQRVRVNAGQGSGIIESVEPDRHDPDDGLYVYLRDGELRGTPQGCWGLPVDQVIRISLIAGIGDTVKSSKHPDDVGVIVDTLFKGAAYMVRWNDDTDAHPVLASLLTRVAQVR